MEQGPRITHERDGWYMNCGEERRGPFPTAPKIVDTSDDPDATVTMSESGTTSDHTRSRRVTWDADAIVILTIDSFTIRPDGSEEYAGTTFLSASD